MSEALTTRALVENVIDLTHLYELADTSDEEAAYQRYQAAKDAVFTRIIEREARLATAEHQRDALRTALVDIVDESSYPIDLADAFHEALERARAALRA